MTPPKPVSVSVDVPNPRTEVYDFLDVMANHEPFTDHMLVDWSYAGPPRGVGSRASVNSKFGPLKEPVSIEVVAAEAPSRIVEHNVSAGGKRTASGTYELTDLPDGGTRIAFTYTWTTAPLGDRVLAPLVRGALRRGNMKAMERLAQQLPASAPAATATA